MFFDSLRDIPEIARKSGFSIFVVPETLIIFPKNTIKITPNEKGLITVDMVRDLEDRMKLKQTTPTLIVVEHADAMNLAAENAALKLLEEPKENYHLVFLAGNLSAFLPTVLSRASVYVFRRKDPLKTPPTCSKKILETAKQLLVTPKPQLPALLDSLIGKKDSRRNVLDVLTAAIDVAYKSYFASGNPNFLKKLPGLLKAQENIQGNGHIRLQLYANLC